jgi:hypothetical protein
MRLDADLDRLGPALGAKQAHLLVDETHKTLHPIQDGLNL